MSQIQKKQVEIGIHLLETITRGMYNNPLHCVREYIQNAFDSIRTARRNRLLGQEDGKIDITVDTHSRTLRIRDDGMGLSPEEAIVKLVDIGYSSKADTPSNAANNAGFRGIGRMAGISYCDCLVFETSDGNRVCRVSFDAKAINHLTHPGRKPSTITEAINNNYKTEEWISDSHMRFLQVTLENVSNETLLNVNELCAYLEQTAPVRQDPTKWSFQPKILSFAESVGHLESLDTITMCIRDADGSLIHNVYRPFKQIFETRDGRNKNLRNVEVKDVVALPRKGKYRGWWGWFAQHEMKGALADQPFSGLCFRMHNIAVGDNSVIKNLWKSQNLATWCFGEVHVVDPSLVPNSQRDNFEPSEVLSQIMEQIRDEVQYIEKDIRKESQERNSSVQKVIKKAERTNRNAKKILADGLTSHHQKAQLIQQLDDELVNINNKINNPKISVSDRMGLEEKRHQLENTKNDISEVKTTTATKSMSHLSKQARKAVYITLDVVKQELKNKEQFNNIEMRVYAALQPGKQHS